jgi:hypothetical protein
MTKYKIKDGVKFNGLQWTEQSSFEGVNKFCVNWLVKTAFGMLRLNPGNYVIKGPGCFKIVLDAASFSEIFEEDK